MNLNFQPYLAKNQKPGLYIGINLVSNRILFSKKFYLKIGKPTSANIGYDIKYKAIKIMPNQLDVLLSSVNFPITKGAFGSAGINCLLSRFMPLGKYILHEEKSNGFICKLENNV